MSRIDEFYGVDIRHNKDFKKVAGGGDLQDIGGIENVRQALFRRLVTPKGTIPHRPNYGVGINRFQNTVNSIATQIEMAAEIGEQFPLDFRVEDVLGVRIVVNDDTPEKITIISRIQLVGFGEVEMQFVPFGGEL